MLIKVTIRAQKTNSALNNDVTIKLNSYSVLVTNVTIKRKKKRETKKSKETKSASDQRNIQAKKETARL